MQGSITIAALVVLATAAMPADAGPAAVAWPVETRAEPQKGQERAKPQKQEQEHGRARAQQAKSRQGAQREKPQQARSAQAKERGNAREKAADVRAQDRQPNRAVRLANRRDASRGHGRLSASEVRAHVRELPANVRRLADSDRRSHRFVAGAAARGVARGLVPSAIVVERAGERMRVKNRDGDLLFELDDEDAERLGVWNMRRVEQREHGNAPAFCRSGVGHPVWGREWCVQQGFGLGGDGSLVWGRTRDLGDIVLRPRAERDLDLDRGGLIDVLGDIVFGRLALHALALGFDEPLAGTWVVPDEGPRLLRVRSGDVIVGEFADLDRNDRADVLYVVLPF